MSKIQCRFCRLGTRDPHTGECDHCGRPLDGPELKPPTEAPSPLAVEGEPCPSCGRIVPLSGKTRARIARERKAAAAASGEAAEDETSDEEPAEVAD